MNKRKVIVIGSGPAGYSAAIYLARAKLNPLLLTGNEIGGQPMYTTELENYPGYSEGIMGPKLMNEMMEQAKKFGTEIEFKKIDRVDFEKELKVYSEDEEYVGESVVIATGAESIRLNLTNEDKFFGRGISVCAVCDAAFYENKVAYVVGGGDVACEDSLALTKFAKEVYLVVRKDELRASKIMRERVMSKNNIQILFNTEVVELMGTNKLTGLMLLNNKIDQKREVETDGLFYAIGRRPNSEIFKEWIKIDERGYIINSIYDRESDSKEVEFITMTSKNGVFACGDVVDHKYRQVAVAVGMGVMAGLDCERWLESNH